MKKTTHHGQVDFILQGRFNRCKSRNIINHVSRHADKILMIITIEAENAAFGKNPACFHNRKPRENRNGGNMYNAIKGTDDKPITTIILTEKKKALRNPIKIRRKPTITTSFP